MQYDPSEFIERVVSLVERYDLTVSEKSVGESVAIPIIWRIDKARVEVVIMGKHCTVRDHEEGSSVRFDKSVSGWEQESLDRIEKLLERYKSRGER